MAKTRRKEKSDKQFRKNANKKQRNKQSRKKVKENLEFVTYQQDGEWEDLDEWSDDEWGGV